MSHNFESQEVSVSQFVRLEKKAKALGKTVSEYLSFLCEKKVGTTRLSSDELV